MPEPDPAIQPHDPYAAFRVPSYRFYALGYFISVLGRTAVSVAVGLDIYQRTNSATALGLMGLVGALPVILFALPAGHLADRSNRKSIMMVAQLGMALGSGALVWLSLHHAQIPDTPLLRSCCNVISSVAGFFGEKDNIAFDPAVPLMFGALFVSSCSRAFGWAARGAFVANVVQRDLLANAITWNSSLSQLSSTLGPLAAGYVILKLGIPAAYTLDVICALTYFGCLAFVRHRREAPIAHTESASAEALSGIRFVWRTKAILGTITLDLFAVLIGGATALLPIFADKILHVGPDGLGWLRSAPSVGALTMGFALAHMRPMQHAGRVLLWSVAGFGLATAVFGLSHSFLLSFVALAFTGALDNISVVVRHTLVQMLTPDSMRGRVSAVNNVFINSSNELGQLESGLTAALFGRLLGTAALGASASVAAGGIGVILVVILVALTIPEVRKIGALRDVKPEE
jgi:MFS family permease